MQSIIHFFVFMFSITISAQVYREAPEHIFTIDDSLHIVGLPDAYIQFGKDICYKKTGTISCLEEGNTKKKIYKILDDILRPGYKAAPLGWFCFYDEATFKFEDIYLLISPGTFLTLDNEKIDGIENLIRHRYGSIEKFKKLKAARQRKD